MAPLAFRQPDQGGSSPTLIARRAGRAPSLNSKAPFGRRFLHLFLEPLNIAEVDIQRPIYCPGTRLHTMDNRSEAIWYLGNVLMGKLWAKNLVRFCQKILYLSLMRPLGSSMASKLILQHPLECYTQWTTVAGRFGTWKLYQMGELWDKSC